MSRWNLPSEPGNNFDKTETDNNNNNKAKQQLFLSPILSCSMKKTEILSCPVQSFPNFVRQ